MDADPVDAEPLLLGLGAPLINWVAWMAYRIDHDESILHDDIAVVTRDEYLAFKNSREGRAYPTGTTNSLPRSSTVTKSPADEFRKGIRRDMNLFETFKNDAFEPWQRRVINQACAQGVAHVLDPTYVPMVELFLEMQRYM